MPFPYLLLPKLIKYEVLQRLDTVDFVYFSLISSKTKAIAKLSCKKIDSLSWGFRGPGYGIIVESPKDSFCSLRVPVWPKDIPVLAKLNQELVESCSGPIYLCFGSYYLSEADKRKLFKQLNDLVFDIFKVKECGFLGNIFRYKDLVSKYTKKLERLIIDEIDIQPELSNVLEEFGVEELDVEPTETPLISPLNVPLKVKNLKCANLKWLTMECFWSMDCEKLTLDAGCLQIDQLNELIKRWIAGGWQNLKEFKIRLWPEDADLVRIFEDIETDQNDDDSYTVQREDETSARIAVEEEIGFVITIEN